MNEGLCKVCGICTFVGQNWQFVVGLGFQVLPLLFAKTAS